MIHENKTNFIIHFLVPILLHVSQWQPTNGLFAGAVQSVSGE